MNTSIHPYKGYLNTQFRVFVKGENPLSFQVFSAEQEELAILNGVVDPNQPYNITMPSAGEFVIRFEDGSEHNFRVEDGYRYGGNKLKNAFIFDDCPWAFVVMHDRTYFYNRKTQQSFFEPIAPDEIEEVSSDYVLFKSDKQHELTLFSLERQEPILWFDNITFYTKKVICWEDKKEVGNDTDSIINLVLYSLSEQRQITRVACDKYSFDRKNNSLFYHLSAQIHKINLDAFDDIIVHQYKEHQKFMTFVNMHYAVSYAASQSKLYVLDAINREARGEILVQGNLAKVNDISLISINRKTIDFRNFDFESFEIPEASLRAQYTEINIYPCDWEIDEKKGCKIRTLYTEKVTTLQVSCGQFRNSFSHTDETNIKSIESDFSQSIDNINGTFVATENYFHFFNRNESLVIPRFYPNCTSYHKDKTLLRFGGSIAIKSDTEVRFLTSSGFWDGKLVGDYDTSYLDTFRLLKNKENNIFYNLAGTELGKFKNQISSPYERLNVGDYAVYPGGEFITFDNNPQYLSLLGRMGLTITEKDVTLFEVRHHKVSKVSQILQDIYETQNYTNVLLGENGKQVIFRDNKQAKMLDLVSGETFEFENLSYINHINGIRPFFRLLETSQALLINPVDGQPINFNLVNEYQFVSPDYTLYADKALNQYIEYYDHIQQLLISKEQYQELYEKFSLSTSNDSEREKRIQNRKDFVIKHSSFLIDILREKGYKDRSVEEFHKSIVDEKNTFGTSRFIDLFIEKRGVAVIKRLSDDAEVVRIPLGTPLQYINYAAFSYDNRYVALAGCYPLNTGGGLFLIYDLINLAVICRKMTDKAVWSVSFSKEGAISAYTSTPVSFFASSEHDYSKSVQNENIIDGYNFLSFSPDGKFFACSEQRYISYRKGNGETRTIWGHQHSSLVSIRATNNPHDELVQYKDLSDYTIGNSKGIAGSFMAQSVASVSFSNDNSRLMMVGNDGVVIIRNIHL